MGASECHPLVLLTNAPSDARTLYCVHGADGGVTYVRRLARELNDNVHVYGLEARGIDGSAPSETHEEEAAYLLSHIFARDPGPYILAGYSAGGGIAYEMAQQIIQRGGQVELVFMFDAIEPSSMAKPLTWGQRLRMLPQTNPHTLLRWPLNRYRYYRDSTERKARNGVVGNQIFEAFLRSQARYVARPYDGDIFIVRARRASAYHVRAGAKLGWEEVVRGNIETCELDCSHLAMYEEPAIIKLAEIVRDRLARLPPKSRPKV